MKARFYVITLGFILMAGCKSQKVNSGVDITTDIETKYWDNQFTFNDIELRGKGTIKQNGKDNNVSLHLKMSRDSLIWARISLLGFDIAKFYINQDSFFMVDYFNSSYMAYPLGYLNNLLGFSANVGKVQNLLIGNALFLKKEYLLNSSDVNLDGLQGNVVNSLQINEQFRTSSSRLTSKDSTQNADIQYDEYFEVGSNLLPKNVNITMVNATQNINAVLNYQHIKTDPINTFPFYIPNGFQRR